MAIVRVERLSRTLKLGVAAIATSLVVAACGGPSQAQKASALLSSGVVAQSKGNLALAASDYSQAIAIEPSNKYALYDLGLVEQLQGQLGAAATHYQAAIAIDPTFVASLFNLAITVTHSAPLEAEDLYRQVLNISPKYAAAMLNLGYVMRSLGHTTAGNAEILKAIALVPSLASHAPKGLVIPKSGTSTTTTTTPGSHSTTTTTKPGSRSTTTVVG